MRSLFAAHVALVNVPVHWFGTLTEELRPAYMHVLVPLHQPHRGFDWHVVCEVDVHGFVIAVEYDVVEHSVAEATHVPDPSLYEYELVHHLQPFWLAQLYAQKCDVHEV